MTMNAYNEVSMEEDELEKVKDASLPFLNIRSLRCHYDQLNEFTEGFSNKPLVIALFETWLTDSDPTTLYKINGFSNIVTHNRSGQKSGGCAFFVNENVELTVKHLGDQMEDLIFKTLKHELRNKLSFTAHQQLQSLVF